MKNDKKKCSNKNQKKVDFTCDDKDSEDDGVSRHRKSRKTTYNVDSNDSLYSCVNRQCKRFLSKLQFGVMAQIQKDT